MARNHQRLHAGRRAAVIWREPTAAGRIGAMTSAIRTESAPPSRKEDERFLRGQGQYVADIRIPARAKSHSSGSGGACACGAWCRTIPRRRAHRRGPDRRQADLVNPTLRGFRHSTEPILATDKLRFVGEITAMCMARTRAGLRTSRAR
jgi:hypothetical protein